MDQSRVLNALAPFVALAKSANSPRAASDLITQATSAANTYVFAELLQQPNIQALAGNEQYGSFYTLLQTFAWGTWESYKSTPDLPTLSDAQARKLRLLSLLTIASQKPSLSAAHRNNLSYTSLAASLDLTSAIDLEHLVTEAIYNDLIAATLNPESQTVVITSVAPLRDLAPGSVQSMMAELAAWSGRCDSALAGLEVEIKKVKSEAERRAKREATAERQIKAVTDAAEKNGGGVNNSLGGGGRSGHNTRGNQKRGQVEDQDDDDDDPMEVDGGLKKKALGGGSLFGRLTGNGRR